MTRIKDELAGAVALFLQEKGYHIETELGETRLDGFSTVTFSGKPNALSSCRFVSFVCKAPYVFVDIIHHTFGSAGTDKKVFETSSPDLFDAILLYIGLPGTKNQYGEVYNYLMLKQQERKSRARKW